MVDLVPDSSTILSILGSRFHSSASIFPDSGGPVGDAISVLEQMRIEVVVERLACETAVEAISGTSRQTKRVTSNENGNVTWHAFIIALLRSLGEGTQEDVAPAATTSDPLEL
jgi:hypothetical protein